MRHAELIRREVGAADTPSEAGAKGGKGNKAVDIIKSLGGTDPTYILRRLKRDHPELAEMVVAGKLSAHAAPVSDSDTVCNLPRTRNVPGPVH